MRRGLPIAIRYYRSLPNRRVAGYLVATFLIFGAAGFIGDAMHPPVQRSWQGTEVMASAVISGVIAVLFALSPMRSWWFLPFAVVALVVGQLGIEAMWQARANDWAAAPAGFDAIQHRLTVDGRSATASLILGFVLLVRFIRTEGVRQTRLRAEIDLAQAIHESLVPPIAFASPAFETRGCSVPSSEVGGDLVDAVEHDGCLATCVADVAGHGVPAGALMAMVRGALHPQLPVCARLETLLADVNRLLVELGRPDRFVTLACLRFDGVGGAEYALAGHLPILRVRPGARAVERFENLCPPLGVQPGAEFTSGRTVTAAGDLFAIFTDGLSEVRDRAQREFGIGRVEGLLLEHVARPLAEIEREVFAAAERHGKRLDDQTLLLVRVR